MPDHAFDENPFPGMNPYIERKWLGVHASLIIRLADSLNRRLPDDLVAAPGERTEIVPDDDEPAPPARLPDVAVTGRPYQPGGEPSAAVAEMIEAQPGVVMAAVMGPAKERFLHIIDADNENVITAIELISPSNKRPPGLDQFRDERNATLDGGANWVEIDLVRTGDWRRLMGLVTVVGSDDETDTPYRISIWSPSRRHMTYLFPIRLQDPLPSLAVPLRPGDPRVEVELQPLLDEVYLAGRYARRVSYDAPPEPPLVGDEATWAVELLASRRSN